MTRPETGAQSLVSACLMGRACRYDGTSFAMYLDGAAAGIPAGADLDGADVRSTGDVLFSVDVPAQLGALESLTVLLHQSDELRVIPNSIECRIE